MELRVSTCVVCRNNGLASVCAPLIAPNNSVHKMALDLVRGSNIDKSQPLICKGFSSAPTGVSWYTGEGAHV